MSSRNDMDPATAQTVWVKLSAYASASLVRGVTGILPEGSVGEHGEGEVAIRSEISASVGRHCRRRYTAASSEWIDGRPAVERLAASRPPCARRVRLA